MKRLSLSSLAFAFFVVPNPLPQEVSQTCDNHAACICTLQGVLNKVGDDEMPTCVDTISITLAGTTAHPKQDGCCNEGEPGCPSHPCWVVVELDGTSKSGQSCAWTVREPDGTLATFTGTLNYNSAATQIPCGDGENFSVTAGGAMVARPVVSCLQCAL